MNNSQPDVKDNSIIITETKNLSSVNEWNDTIKTNWIRKCPKCNDNLSYKNKNQLLKAIRGNRTCKSCAAILRKSIECVPIWKKHLEFKDIIEWARKCPKCNGEVKYKRRNLFLTAVRRNGVCRKCVTSIKKDNPLNLPSFNPRACKYFDQLNQEKGWNLQHALNGGELKCLGYWMDAYDKQRNIVVEYDEPYHNWKSIKKSDSKRQHTIFNILHCDFYRYNEKTKQLLQVHSRNNL